MSSVINIVLQVGADDEALIEHINLLLASSGFGPLHNVPSYVPDCLKLLEVDVYLLTLDGEDELADQITDCVRNYPEETRSASEIVLILTRHDQSSEVIRPNM